MASAGLAFLALTRVSDGGAVASGSTVLAAFDYGRRRMSRLPRTFQASLQALAGA
jgi:acyl-CoA thioesterase FadM